MANILPERKTDGFVRVDPMVGWLFARLSFDSAEEVDNGQPGVCADLNRALLGASVA